MCVLEMKGVANTTEPPIVIPIIVVLVDIHVTLVIPCVKGLVAEMYEVPPASPPIEYSLD